MADTTKKTTSRAKTSAVKKDAKAAEKPAAVKEAAAPEKKPVEKAAVKEETKPAAAKKETVKKQPAKAAVKAEVKETVHFQFSGKTYTTEELLKIFRDVWKYDLKRKEEDIKSVELYVKPEENVTYYVANGDVTGCFAI